MDARLDDQAERLARHLRGLGATLCSAELAEAADLIDRLYAELFLAEEQIALLEAPDEPEEAARSSRSDHHRGASEAIELTENPSAAKAAAGVAPLRIISTAAGQSAFGEEVARILFRKAREPVDDLQDLGDEPGRTFAVLGKEF